MSTGAVCKVCGDRASGKHYGVVSCDGCRGFFKRSIRRNLEYVCKDQNRCVVDLSRRNQCQSCRFSKCLNVNMRREAVQHERAPRSCPPVPSSFGMDFARSSAAFGSGSFFVPLPLHQSMTPMLSYFPSLPPAPHMDQQRVRLLSESLFGRSSISPISAEQIRDSFSFVKEDEVSSSVMSQDSSPASCGRFTKDTIFETAAKLLFMAVKWAKSLPSYTSLPIEDRYILIKESWADLFVLTCAQWNIVDSNIPTGNSSMEKLRTALDMYSVSCIDLTEAACLKAIVLFRPERPGLLTRQQIACLQDQTICLLNEKSGPIRSAHLLLLLTTIKQAADPQQLQEVFFKRTLGQVAVERILEDLLKT